MPTKLRIRHYGDPALRRRAKAVMTVTDKERAELQEMSDLMRLAGGIGLAAPQVGLAKQMLVADVGEGPVYLINPRITKCRGAEALEEGCLSLPGVYVQVKRARSVSVSARNENNQKVLIQAKDLLARVLQHEIDHLRGRLIIDYANIFQKIKLKRRLRSIPKTEDGLF